MGLLKIFTRRSSKSKLQGHDTQPRLQKPLQGSWPLHEYEPHTSETLTSQQQTDASRTAPGQLDQSETWESASAPSPFVPRHPSRTVEDRPRTADSIRILTRERSPLIALPKREPKKPPVSFRKPSSAASISTTYQCSTQGGDKESDAGSLLMMRRKNGSRSSFGSIRSKDILDAQEQIRPTDFRSRVRAAGSRDYGEDVADRNIARHRIDNLSATPDFLQMSNRTKSLNSTSEFPPVTQPHDANRGLGSVLRKTSLTDVGGLHSFSSRNKRRLSLNTYIPTGMASPCTPRSAATSPGLKEDIASRDFALPAAKVMTAERQKDLSRATNNFSLPRSPRFLQAAGTIEKTSMTHNVDPALKENLAQIQASTDICASEPFGHQRTSDQSLAHAFNPRSSGRQSYQTVRSSLASSIPSRYPSTDFTPLGYPSIKRAYAHNDTNSTIGGIDAASLTSQPPFSHQHSRSNDSENQLGYHLTRSLGFLSSPLEADEQNTMRNDNLRNWSLSETSKSDTTAHSNLFSAASGRSHSRHTANTSLDSKSAESFLAVSNGQQGVSSDCSPAKDLVTGFNIDDYVSSDDEYFVTEIKGFRPTGKGEEDLLFKTGYGITGVALPGLEALGEEDERYYSVGKSTRSDSVSSGGSAAVASSPIDGRFGMNPEPSTTLRHVRSDPDELHISTLGRSMMRNGHNRSMVNVWSAKGDDPRPAVELDGFYTPSTSASESEPPLTDRDLKSAAGTLGDFRQPRSESSFSVYPVGGAVTTTITSGAEALEDVFEDEIRPSGQGLKRLSALGTLYGWRRGSLGSSDRRPITATDDAIGEETTPSDIIRKRKEDKNRKRGLKNIREKRMTEAFGGSDSDGKLRGHWEYHEEMW